MQRSPLNKPLKLLMSKLLLHLDADTSIKALHQALVSRGHDFSHSLIPDIPTKHLNLLPQKNQIKLLLIPPTAPWLTPEL